MADMDSDSDDLTAGPIIHLGELDDLEALHYETDDDFDIDDIDAETESDISDEVIAGTSASAAPLESDTETKDDEGDLYTVAFNG